LSAVKRYAIYTSESFEQDQTINILNLDFVWF